MQTRAVLCLPLFDRKDSLAQPGELNQFLLDCLQSLLPLAVSDLSFRFVAASTPILRIQLLKLRDLSAKTPYFFAKHCQVIHSY
jgi:hypothetical protein